MSDNTLFVITENDSEEGAQKIKDKELATFEDAATLTGFGKFNVLLILLLIPGIWAPIFETTTMSYIFASAQCDLELSLEDKGYLNSITYAGMITCAPVWGFLIDTLGRKKLLIGGFLLDAAFIIISAFSQSTITLIISKFLGGVVITGPFAAMITYLSEFHCSKYRPKIQLVIGTMNSIGGVILPLLAWVILPQPWNFSFGYLEVHPWNAFLLISGFPSLFSGIVLLFLPESPKFLMTIGENKKALSVFQKVYSINTGKPDDSFPIKELIDEIKLNKEHKHGGHVTAKRTMVKALMEGCQQITPLFYPPYIAKLILVCLIQFCTIQSLNILRLWLPQIFQVIDDYEHYNNGTSGSLCTMLELLKPTPAAEECSVNMDNSPVYVNSIIVGLITMSGYALSGFVINLLGKKKLMVILGLLAGLSSCLIYISPNTVTTIALSAIFITLTGVNAYVLLAVIVDLFPTTLRTLTVALTMMMSTTGAMCGNLLFPILLHLGCAPPFFYVGAVTIVSALLCFFLPNTDNKALK